MCESYFFVADSLKQEFGVLDRQLARRNQGIYGGRE